MGRYGRCAGSAVGLAALATAKIAGALKTVVVGGPAHRLNMAKEFGADYADSIADVANVNERRARVL